ncbi:MAG: hypothetical protein P0Y62_06280 [Candidatus Chryseobacterium colombiense]|nr:hypothetical protein [Chryseobacterium sp.]WEK71160.1 MAG: hypothetical protein P0Y62_06280 [Chryseobacterium sp.]
MSKKKTSKHQSIDSSNLFELEHLIKFQEMKLDVAMKMLAASGIIVSEDEAAEILQFFHTIAKITIKEFLISQN